MVWESQRSIQGERNKQNPINNYTKHYVYEPNGFVPLFQTGYVDFIKLIETPDYSRFQNEPYSIYKDPVWNTETRKNKAELERVAFYHCDQVGTPQTLSNELGECVWEIKQDTWGVTQEITTANETNPFEQSNIRFQGQYYDSETGLHYNRYRYYEPFSAKYVSKDPIGLHGGLNNSAYVSDPNQWVDPMGLNGNKDNRGLFGITDSAIEESDKQIKQMEQKAKSNLNRTKTQLELLQVDVAKGRVVRANTLVVSSTETERNDFPQIQNKTPKGGGILGALVPAHMAGLAKDPNLGKELQGNAQLRNITLGGANVAGYAPIILTTAGYGYASAGPIAQSAIGNGASASALDASKQAYDSYKCNCNQFSLSHILLTGGVGAATGVWGTGMSRAAGVKEVSGSRISDAIVTQNWQGITIFGMTEGMSQIGGLVVDSAAPIPEKAK